MDKKKIINANDNDVLNPMADVHKYGAGTEDGIKPEPGEEDISIDKNEIDNDGVVQDKPFPDELVDPEEQEDDDEIP
jgi:hypothetical protein